MQQYEYLVVDNGFMSTNRTGLGSMTTEAQLGAKLTNEYGKQGWKLVAVVGDDFVFIRPLQEQLEAQAEAVEKVKTKKASKKSNE